MKKSSPTTTTAAAAANKVVRRGGDVKSANWTCNPPWFIQSTVLRPPSKGNSWVQKHKSSGSQFGVKLCASLIHSRMSSPARRSRPNTRSDKRERGGGRVLSHGGTFHQRWRARAIAGLAPLPFFLFRFTRKSRAMFRGGGQEMDSTPTPAVYLECLALSTLSRRSGSSGFCALHIQRQRLAFKTILAAVNVHAMTSRLVGLSFAIAGSRLKRSCRARWVAKPVK